jgi:hypothetical protein
VAGPGALGSLERLYLRKSPMALAKGGIRRFPGDSDTHRQGKWQKRSSGRGRTGAGAIGRDGAEEEGGQAGRPPSRGARQRFSA